MAQQDRATRTRQKIIIAAAEAINEFSFEKSSLADIAERGGMSKGAISHHFRSKDELAREVIQSQTEYSQAKIAAVTEAETSAVHTMLSTSADLMYDVVEDPLVRAGIRLLVEIRLLKNPPSDVWDNWTNLNEVTLMRAHDQGHLKSDVNIRDAASLIVTNLVGVIIYSHLREDLPGILKQAYISWRDFIRANMNESLVPGFVTYAREAFLGRPPRPLLTADEALDLHLESSKERTLVLV